MLSGAQETRHDRHRPPIRRPGPHPHARPPAPRRAPAAEAGIAASGATYDRKFALARFHRLSPEIIETETPEAARAVVREIERALRRERARRGHWTYDLNRHIALLVAHRGESERAARLAARA